MNTKEAFEQLISQRGWYKDLGLPEGTGSSVKTYYKKGKITLDRMEYLLKKAGYTVMQEKSWDKGQY